MKKVIGRLFLLIILVIAIIVGGLYFYCIVEKENQKEVVNEVFEDNIEYQYYYEKLDDNDQESYRFIYYAFKTFQKEITIDNISLQQVEKIYNDVLMDHPEIFYVKTSFRYIQKDNNIQIMPQYSYDKEEVKTYNQKIEKETQSIMKQANKETTSLNKMKIIYDYLIETISYQNNDDDQNILSALIDKKSVCAGYAKAYQYLLLKVGIKSAYLTGTAIENNESHAWVMVCIQDDYYYSDPTWGDIEDKEMKHHCYATFLMNSEEMLKCYKPSERYEKTSSNEINYYQNIDCYMEEYDQSILSYAVKLGLKNETRIAEVKCANDVVYQQLKKNIKNSYLAYNVLTENRCYNGKARYSYRDDLRIIELFY